MAYTKNGYPYQNPFQKSMRYSQELKNKRKYNYNSKQFDGPHLKPSEAGYRIGYNNCRNESTRLFKYKNPGYQRKTCPNCSSVVTYVVPYNK